MRNEATLIRFGIFPTLIRYLKKYRSIYVENDLMERSLKDFPQVMELPSRRLY